MAQPQNPLAAAEECAAPPSGLAGAVHAFISFCLEGGIHLWVQLTGRLVRKSDAPWLGGPLGGRERNGTGIYERIAQAENLLIRTPDFSKTSISFAGRTSIPTPSIRI